MNPGQNYITASDVANYVVCPEAWRLKYFKNTQGAQGENRRLLAQAERRLWSSKTQLYQNLRSHTKVALILLFILTSVVFIFEGSRGKFLYKLASKYQVEHKIPYEITAFILILGLIIFIWDLFERRKNKLAIEVGLQKTHNTVAIKGSENSPAQELSSEKLKLRSKPDALIKEKNMFIPVDYHPFAKKVKDRHVAQILVHLYLIEESMNIKPEYGVIILGKEKREVKLKNTEEKQKWLQNLIAEMRSIQAGVPAVPLPSFYKCKSCDVQSICSFSVYKAKESTSEDNNNIQDPEEE